ncbi:MAG: HAMP domain-containing histidine kinase [Lachnospiraceae bacterium]|nr:HAMP domain-containing histidine kinase [Lachnospiraceae bacterium]
MFRNREIRQLSMGFLLITAFFAAAGFLIHPMAALLTLCLATALGILFYSFTRARYQSIARISHQIDQTLHNAECLYISEAEEGELSILQSEIVKMTMRIREQNHALLQDKKHLADSLADISHQLRTPLTSVNIILSLLEKTPDKSQQKSLIREAGELFAQMDFLLTSLLKLSRLDADIVIFQKEPIQLKTLITASLRPLLIPMDLHNIQLQTEIPTEIEITGDAHWLSEAIQNIVKNCMESAGDNGTIHIACTDNPLFTEIIIQDDGAGFEKEDLPHLFERFYQGKNSAATGYGIGLALSKTILLRQEATITARNHPQGGAIFSIRFPK